MELQKKSIATKFKFRPVHLQWTGVHFGVGAALTNIVANRLPDGRTAVNYFEAATVALLVFAVYGIERFLTYHKLKTDERYAFAKQFRKIAGQIVIGCIILAAFLSWFVSESLWKYGFGLSLFTGLVLWYLSKKPSKSNLQAFREIFYAVIYLLAIWGNTLFFKDSMEREGLILAGSFLLFSFQSLLISAHFDASERSVHMNIARWLGKKQTRQLIYGIGLVILIGCIFACWSTEYRYIQRIAVVFAAMGLVQAFIFQRSEHTYEKYFRIFSELVCLFPIMLI